MYYRQGSDLATRLEPADREVVVIQDCCPPTEAAIEGISRFDLLTRTSDAVVLLRVSAVAAHMTPDRDWINSTVTADVDTVLKGGDRGLVSGALIVFEVDEGTLVQGDIRIVARRTWAVPLEEGATYLAFLERKKDGGFRPLAPSHTFAPVGDSYRPLIAHSDFSLPVDKAGEEIRRSSMLPRLDFGARQ